MHNFGDLNLVGYTGIVKPRSYHLPSNPTVLDMTFQIESGPGCYHTKGTRRTIKGKWLSDDVPDTINSYDFSYVVGRDNKKVYPTPEAVSDVQPVQLESEIQATKTRAPRGRAAWKEKP